MGGGGLAVVEVDPKGVPAVVEVDPEGLVLEKMQKINN